MFAASETTWMGCTETTIRKKPAVILSGNIEKRDVSEFDSELELTLHYRDVFIERAKLRRRTDTTIMNYHIILTAISRFLDERGMRCDPFAVSEKEILEIIDGYDVSENSLKFYLTVYKMFIETVADNPTIKNIGILWNDNDCPNAAFIGHEDYIRMWDNSENDPLGRIILVLGGRCGLRRGEMIKMQVSDIKDNSFMIRGKGHGNGKHRVFPLTECIKEELNKYLAYREELKSYCNKDQTDGSFLVNMNMSNKNLYTLCNHRIMVKVREMGEAIGQRVTPHTLRRHYITEMGKTITPYALSRSVGHSDLNLLMRYNRNDPEELKKGMEIHDKEYIR